eukprot:scpid91199/ scgid22505/ 
MHQYTCDWNTHHQCRNGTIPTLHNIYVDGIDYGTVLLVSCQGETSTAVFLHHAQGMNTGCTCSARSDVLCAVPEANSIIIVLATSYPALFRFIWCLSCFPNYLTLYRSD